MRSGGMPTVVSTLGATATITSLAFLGLVLTSSDSSPGASSSSHRNSNSNNGNRDSAADELPHHLPDGPTSGKNSRGYIPGTARAAADMSTTTTTTVETYIARHQLFAPLPTRRGDGTRTRSNSANTPINRPGSKRHSYAGFSTTGMDRSLRRPQQQEKQQREEYSGASDTTPASGPAANGAWLRRLSSTLTTSRDSSRTPSSRSRPDSAAVSHSNASLAIPQTRSPTPILNESTISQPGNALGANKLVKRSASSSSANGSSTSRIPVFRRPATSHQRSATLQNRLSSSDRSSRMTSRSGVGETGTHAAHQRSYFSPRIVLSEQLPMSKQRGSTGIPNPIRRLYADRKHTPTLMSAREMVFVDAVGVDNGMNEFEHNTYPSGAGLAKSTASSPFPTPVAHFEESASPRRSFSIGDLLSTGPQPLWKRPSTSNSTRPWSSRTIRRQRPASMGGLVDTTTRNDSDRPAKRRDLTDPASSQRSIYSSSSSNYTFQPDITHEVGLHLNGELSQAQNAVEPISASASLSRAQTPDQNGAPFDAGITTATRIPRGSATPSEIASSIGSESGRHSIGGNSTDYQSDVYYDSIPTRTTRSSSGRRGPPIDTIFDESPPTFSSGRSTRLRDFLSDGHEHNERYSTIEEEGSVVSTPVRSLRNRSITSTPSARPGAMQVFSSSPPVMRLMPDADDIDWELADEERLDGGRSIQQRASNPALGKLCPGQTIPPRFSAALRPGPTRSAKSTPDRHGYSPLDKPSLFDWAEPQPSPSHPNCSPPRPRTVHGKKDQDSRGSRPAGRRPPSGMHARSHSVPVVPDSDSKRSSVVANKFGTWGVGSKGVTEDWNDDFDFEEPAGSVHDKLEQDSRRVDSGHAMFVPKSIREQQQNVVANISLLREWGLLIEELKELRVRAVTLDMLTGPYAQAWREVDAMIELADQESEEDTLEPRRTPPSSPGFDVTAFEDVTPVRANRLSGQAKLGPQTSDTDTWSRNDHERSPKLVTRPRKDSELVAQKVIAALQSKRSAVESHAIPMPGGHYKKVPFDTATLRHIVPYVSGLKRKVKDALRETEGLYTSPQRRKTVDNTETTALRSIFGSPQDDDVTNRRLSRRKQATADNDGLGLPLPDQSTSLTNSMENLSIPSPP